MEMDEKNYGLEPRARGTQLLTAEATPFGGFYAARSLSIYNWEQAVRVLKKNLKLILLVMLGVTALVALYAFYLKDRYEPTARLEIDPPGSGHCRSGKRKTSLKTIRSMWKRRYRFCRAMSLPRE